jgi:acyl-CoA synthetase (NDP forming)/ribosomal protein S18 acetylase RimI-like enzyme
VLSDGGTILLREAQGSDLGAVSAFLTALSPESRRLRFLEDAADIPEAAAWACQPPAPGALRLLALRGAAVVGHGAYETTEPDAARVSLVVADEVQHRGLGTILLGRLAQAAAAVGVDRFRTEVAADNHGIIDLFRHSGFRVTLRSRPGKIVLEHPTALTPQALDRFERREELAAAAAVAHVLRPTSVAVIGASRDRDAPGGEVLANLLSGGFTGPVYPVNPSCDQVQGIPAYPSIGAVPGPVELAVIVVPARHVAGVARECATAGVKALVVISAGFAEEGGEGVARQRELVEVCRQSGMRMIGPNCMGVINTDPAVRLHATFAPVKPTVGRVALVSQSGGLGLAAMALADELNLGLSTFVSIGNRADISPNDLLQYLGTDPSADVVLLYLESFGNPRKFGRIARRVSATTPIVAVKGGRSAAGARATASHTGALVAASEATVGALFLQSGVIRTDTLEGLLDVGTLLAHFPLPAGPRVAVVANAGGLGVLAADACADVGLAVPELSAPLRERLGRIRPGAAARNPIDLLPGASAQDLDQVVRAIAGSGEVDAIVGVWVQPAPGKPGDPADRLLDLAWEAPGGLPVVPAVIGDSSIGRGLAVFGAPERAVRALGLAWNYRAWRDADHGRVPPFDVDADGAAAVIATALASGGGWLGARELDRLFRCYGMPLVDSAFAATAAQAGTAADELGGVVALKALGPTLLHKTEAGAVLLDLKGGTAVTRKADKLLARLKAEGHQVDGLLVQKMAPAGVELIAGMVNDPTFGPVIACGAGGTVTELLGDVALRLTPLTDLDASQMVRELRTFPLLNGYRGAEPVDVAAVEDILLRLSRLAEDHPEIAELDCNPVVATPSGAIVVDARVKVALPPPPPT